MLKCRFSSSGVTWKVGCDLFLERARLRRMLQRDRESGAVEREVWKYRERARRMVDWVRLRRDLKDFSSSGCPVRLALLLAASRRLINSFISCESQGAGGRRAMMVFLGACLSRMARRLEERKSTLESMEERE